MEPYARAIAQAVRPGDVVLDVGAGTGILGYLACRAGASRVHAIEPSDILELAREIAAANGLADRIVHRRLLSFDVDLPARADVAIVSMLSRFGVEDGILPSVLDLKARLLRPGARFVPAAVELWTAPVDIPEWYDVSVRSWLRPSDGGSYQPAAAAVVARTASTIVPAGALLGAPTSAARLEFATLDSPSLRCRVTHRVSRAGAVHAVAGWSEWTFSDGDVSGNRPGGSNTWGQLLFPFDQPVSVAPGDRVELELDMDQISPAAQRWAWTVRATSGTKGIVAECRHLNAEGDANGERLVSEGCQAEILGLFDGHRTVQAIADAVAARHPAAFRSAGEAVRTVAVLARRWSV